MVTLLRVYAAAEATKRERSEIYIVNSGKRGGEGSERETEFCGGGGRSFVGHRGFE